VSHGVLIGRYLISGSGDQTVRLWNLKTREMIVQRYGEWVLWTPQGYAKPGLDILRPTIGTRGDSGQATAHADPDHHREDQPSA
jgi:hypothetical protein